MPKIHRLLYIRLFRWNLNTWGREDMPEWNAVLGVAFMQLIHALTFTVLLAFFGIDLILSPFIKVIALGISLILLFINRAYFLNESRFNELHSKYFNLEYPESVKVTIALWMYVLGSFGLLIGLLYLYKEIGPIITV